MLTALGILEAPRQKPATSSFILDCLWMSSLSALFPFSAYLSLKYSTLNQDLQVDPHILITLMSVLPKSFT